MTGPLYDSVMAVHVLAAVVGFGALGSTGAYAAAARRSDDPFSAPAVQGFFRTGTNWAERTILLVPLLGGVLLALGHGQDVSMAWPWIGLGIWTTATGIASAILWPAEREIQACIAADERSDRARATLARSARRAERAAAATSLLFVAALVVMVWQPR